MIITHSLHIHPNKNHYRFFIPISLFLLNWRKLTENNAGTFSHKTDVINIMGSCSLLNNGRQLSLLTDISAKNPYLDFQPVGSQNRAFMANLDSNTLTTALARSFVEPENTRDFSASAFFSAWFQDMGSAYFFLFKKNLRVTNIQFAELLSLIRVHTTLADGSSLRDLQFLSRAEFTTAFASLVEGFDQEFTKPEDIIANIADHYLSLINPIIVLESFFGSCAVFIPPHLKLDIKSVCGESGYIHSCGRNVYTRNVNKAEKSKFFDSLKAHLSKFHMGGKKILCAPYAHEDFTKHDRKQASDLRDGLDDVKIYLEKFHMGSDSLVRVFKDMLYEPEFENRLVIPEAGDFNESLDKIRKREGDNLEDIRTYAE